jgi:hypothetical protein
MSAMTMVSMAEDFWRWSSADLPAEAGVGRREREKGKRERDEDEIGVHGVVIIAPPGPRA